MFEVMSKIAGILNTSFTESASDIMKALLVKSASNFAKGSQGMVLDGKLSIRSGQLVRDIQSNPTIRKTGGKIIAEKRIANRYAHYHENGGIFRFRSKEQIKAMFGRLRSSGEFRKGMRGSFPGHYRAKKRPFIKPAIEYFKSNPGLMEKIIIRNIDKAFPNRTVVIKIGKN